MYQSKTGSKMLYFAKAHCDYYAYSNQQIALLTRPQAQSSESMNECSFSRGINLLSNGLQSIERVTYKRKKCILIRIIIERPENSQSRKTRSALVGCAFFNALTFEKRKTSLRSPSLTSRVTPRFPGRFDCKVGRARKPQIF